MKTVYNTNNAEPIIAYEDPLDGGIILPNGAVETAPPEFDRSTHTCSFDGTQWVVTEIPVPEPDYAQEPIPAMDQLRMQRDSFLMQSDYRMLSDYTGSDASSWVTYRKALRDLPANSPNAALDENGQLTGVNWPTPPST